MKEYVWVLHERNDKYEFPVFIADTSKEIADKLGIGEKAVNKRVRENKQTQSKYIITKVELE